jgi:F-type H+/Na+-transporting ATPase subunit alpha
MNDEFASYLNSSGEVGYVRRVISSLAYIEGLPSIRPLERVMFENGSYGYVNAFTDELVEIMSFSDTPLVDGMRVARTNKQLTIPVGDEFLGTIINPLGLMLQKNVNQISPQSERTIDVDPLPIRAHARVTQPCTTGTTIADLMIPLGKGQRTLVIGDQKSGKTSFLLRALISQIREGSIGIYVIVGKSKLFLKQIEDSLTRAGVFDQTIIVSAYAEDPAGIIYLAPFTGMTLAEYFRDAGFDVIIVIDDLTMHANIHRELSLLGRRSPGRNSYPGDMFYIHARLMERAGNYITQHGERSITCLPVIEAPRGDITGYIATNSISMTDGHIYFDYNLFVEGRRPAINPFLSVTRVGRQTQPAVTQEINQLLTSFLTSTRQLETITSFGAELSNQIKDKLEKQEHVTILFNQLAHEIITPALQLYLFALIWNRKWKGSNAEVVSEELHTIITRYYAEAKFRKNIDNTIRTASSLNALLQTITV